MLVIAHRGFSSRYPENTLLAFEEAIEAGADLVETDLRLSRDGTIVCIHDKTLSRTADRGDRIADLDVKTLKQIDIGDGMTVPTFDDVLKLVNGRAGILLDVKVTTDEMVDRVVEGIEQRKAYRGVVYGVRSLDHLDALRRRDSEIPALAFVHDYSEIEELLGRGVHAVRIWEEDLTDERIKVVRDAAFDLWVTAGLRCEGEEAGTIDRARLADLSKKGIDGILVYDPAMAVIEQGPRGLKNRWWSGQ